MSTFIQPESDTSLIAASSPSPQLQSSVQTGNEAKCCSRKSGKNRKNQREGTEPLRLCPLVAPLQHCEGRPKPQRIAALGTAGTRRLPPRERVEMNPRHVRR